MLLKALIARRNLWRFRCEVIEIDSKRCELIWNRSILATSSQLVVIIWLTMDIYLRGLGKIVWVFRRRGKLYKWV